MTKTDAVLVEVLAAVDAIWRPLREVDWSRPTPTVIYEHRVRFASRGLPWPGSGLGEVGRKSTQRTLEGLASIGLVTLHGREKRSSVRLTDRGDIFARALIGLANVDAGHRSLVEVIRLHREMVREIWLAGLSDYADTDDCRDALAVVQEDLMPALCRGWVKSNSDCHGRVWYSATALGRKVARLPEPILPVGLPEMDEDALDLYCVATAAYRTRLRHAKPDCSSEIGFLPESCSIDLRPNKRRRGDG